MEDVTLLGTLGRLLFAGVVALLPGTLVWGSLLGIYAAYRRIATKLSAGAG